MGKRNLIDRENEIDEEAHKKDASFTQLPSSHEMDKFLQRKRKVVDDDFCQDSEDYYGKKYTIDSDEEEEEKKREKSKIGRLNFDEADYGEEDTQVRQYDDIKVTPFNLKDEQEDGYFDNKGTFIFQKNQEIQDSWMDDIDWQQVQQTKFRLDEVISKHAQEAELDNEPEEDCDRIKIYSQLLTIMLPKESVSATLRRLGKCSKEEKIIVKKEAILRGEKIPKTHSAIIMEQVTSAASNLLMDGVTNIYSMTLEAIKSLVTKSETQESKNTNVEDNDEVLWEYKKNKKDETILGPVSTLEIQKLCKSLDPKCAQVRKVGGAFYSTDRIDFDLYL